MDGPIGGEWYSGRSGSGIQRKEKVVPSPLGEQAKWSVVGAKGPLPHHSVNPVVQKSGQQMWTVPVIFKPVDYDEFVMKFLQLTHCTI